MINRDEYLFEETQRYTQWWLWTTIGLIALGTNTLFGYGLFQQLVLGKPWGDKPASNTLLLITTLGTVTLTTGMLLLFYYAALETRISRYGLEYKYRPFINSWKRIEREAIASYSAKKQFVGGYGYRYTFRGALLLNVKGNQFVEVRTHAGTIINLGTQVPEKFIAALQQISRSNSN
ncbi:MAG: hypothetical protein KIT62_06195 [Cyclobacteriaceae bacterium]|nr:hypothetical protein [Cyclobacteriaceae bacterium]